MLKNKLVMIILMIVLVMPVSAEPEQQEATDLIPETVQEEPVELNTINYKQPVSKRKIAKKFLLAMGGVLVSSLLLYSILSLYNRLRFGRSEQFDSRNKTESLDTPDDLSGAVRAFLDKTDWSN